MINLKINDTILDVPEGTSILNAAASVGISIPTLCYHKDLSPFGGCRFCVVEVKSVRLPMTACNTAVAPQMRVLTNSPTVIRYRRAILRMLLSNYYDAGYQRLNGKYGIDEDNELIRFAKQYEVDIASAMAKQPRFPVDSDPNPYVLVDRNKCIQCTRCVRACAEIQGRFVWSQSYRGYQARIVAGDDSTMLASRCESCGACVAYCPTGALSNKMSITAGRADRLVKTTCTYCGIGCQLDLNVKDGKVIRVTSNADVNGTSVNGLHLCVKGRYGYEFIHDPHRHKGPRVREYLLKNEARPRNRGPFVDVDWETALDLVARRFRQIRDADSRKIGVLASGHLLNEEAYLLNKFARQALGTNNIDLISHLYFPNETYGMFAMTNSLDDIANQAQAFFIIGSNLTEQYPVFGARIRQSILRRKIKAVVASPDFINMEEYAAVSLRHKRFTEDVLVKGLMNIILAEGWENEDAINEYPNGFGATRANIDQYPPARVAELTGVPSDTLYAAAEILGARHPVAVLCGSSIASSEAIHSLTHLQLILGNFGAPGGGVNPLRAENNIQGAIDMGCSPEFLPGYQAVYDPVARQKFEHAWNCTVRPEPGADAAMMIAKARALYIVGENILNTSEEAASFRRNLEACEFVVMQETAASETTRYADVILPGVSFGEKTGTVTNTERRVQMVNQAIDPVAQSRADWQIITELGKRLSLGWHYSNSAEIMDEIHALTPIYAGISHERLQQGTRLQWPVDSSLHQGTSILPLGMFSDGERLKSDTSGW